uniref:Uncharacterized protein n=1 Tax=Anguilla anguilla TaxID=7936 RepID=A0A0E9VHR5_ANGAN
MRGRTRMHTRRLPCKLFRTGPWPTLSYLLPADLHEFECSSSGSWVYKYLFSQDNSNI